MQPKFLFGLVVSAVCFVFAMPASARTCRINCRVSYPVDLGTVMGTGKTWNEAFDDASKQCHAKRPQVWFGGSSSCVPKGSRHGDGAECAVSCFGKDTDSKDETIYAESNQDAWIKAEGICKSWCDTYPKNTFGTNLCESHGGACDPQ